MRALVRERKREDEAREKRDNEKNIISRVLIRNTFRTRRCFESKRSLAGSGTQAAQHLLVKRTSLKRVAKQRRKFFWPVDTPEGREKERVDKKKIKRKVLTKRELLLFQLVDLSACQVYLLWWGKQVRSLSSDWMVVRRGFESLTILEFFTASFSENSPYRRA